MDYIGGFFELETCLGTENKYHENSLPLSSGRVCFNFLIQYLKPTKLYLPYFTCNSLIEPVTLNNIDFDFYPLNPDLSMKDLIVLKEGEFIVYINYFGLQKKHISSLLDLYGNKLIIDNTQAFFERSIGNNWSFNSARKFFGVPDGGYLYGQLDINTAEKKLLRNTNIKTDHLVNRLNGRQEMAYIDFLKYESSITCEITLISQVSEKLLNNINYNFVIDKRNKNYYEYQTAFSNINCLTPEDIYEQVPFCYPLLLEKEIDRSNLIKNGIFIPQFWEEVINREMDGYTIEKNLAKRLLPLPLDHRYNESDCNRVIEILNKLV